MIVPIDWQHCPQQLEVMPVALETWIAFVVASTVLLVVPGPTVLMVVSFALSRGRRSGLTSVPGAVTGDFTAMTISLLGAGAVLATSSLLFTVLKLCGAAYLVWLGFRLWRAQGTGTTVPAPVDGTGGGRIFWNTYVVTALNPKTIVFFIAFVPQFVNPAAPAIPQFVILEATFLALAGTTLALWVLLASQARAGLGHPRAVRVTNRIGGSFLIAAGLLTASASRAN